ncbi:hypothetical protein ACS0TY_030728 [Phlomoides rotata]
MLGKRGRPTNMTGITLDVLNMVAPPPSPAAMIGGEFNHKLSSRYYRRSFSGDSHVQTIDLSRRCGLCNRCLVPAHDIYMYR